MRPVDFPEMNATIAKDQPQYVPLPARVAGDRTTSCWALTPRERLRVLLTGRVWLTSLNFGRPLQPARLDAARPF